jgi:hypothetical protein
MGTRLIALAAGVLAAALIVAGCGGDDDSSTTASISKAAFVKKVDAICKQGNKRMELAFVDFLKEHKNIKKPSDSDYEALVGTVLVPSVSQEIEEIRALGVPADDQDEVEEMLDALEEGVETAEDNPQAVTSSSDAVFGIASRLAEEYGLEVCGSR